MSQPCLFRLFETKKELFIAALRGGFGRMLRAFMDAAAEVPEDADAEPVLQALGLSYRRLLKDRTLLLLQMQGYAACDDPETREVVRAAGGRPSAANRRRRSPRRSRSRWARRTLAGTVAPSL